MAHLNVLQTWFDHQSPQVQQNWQMHTKEINLIESSGTLVCNTSLFSFLLFLHVPVCLCLPLFAQ